MVQELCLYLHEVSDVINTCSSCSVRAVFYIFLTLTLSLTPVVTSELYSYLREVNVVFNMIITYKVSCIASYLHDVNFITVFPEVSAPPSVRVVVFK